MSSGDHTFARHRVAIATRIPNCYETPASDPRAGVLARQHSKHERGCTNLPPICPGNPFVADRSF
jgi:hypothetical protein